MLIAVALRKSCAARRASIRASACVLAAALCATALAGCAPDRRGRGSELAGTAETGRSATPQASPAPVRPRAVTAKAGASARPGSRTPIPLPDQALLNPQPVPSCEFKTQPQPGQADPNAERTKLDYERQCYRHAEIIARGRLEQLQASVGATIAAVKRGEQNAR